MSVALTLLSVLAALAPPSAGAAGAAGAAVGLMAETMKRHNEAVNISIDSSKTVLVKTLAYRKND